MLPKPPEVKTITNAKFFDIIDKSFTDSRDFEMKIAKFEYQRFGRDRAKQNNKPWPNASNYRRKKADEVIEQKKAFYSQLIHQSQFVANFKALIPQNEQYAELAEAYFDYIIKEETTFDREFIYALDAGLESGFAFMQVMWDEEKQFPIFKKIDNLYLRFPSKSLHLEDCAWIVNVIQMTREEAKERYGKLPGFSQLLAKSTSSDSSPPKNDSSGLEQDRYERKGINASTVNKFVVWDIHYKDPNNPKKLKRQRTMCPDDKDFDFQDDTAYPYTKADGTQEYMFKQYRREWTTPDLYSSRGVPEILWEEEVMLTSLARLKHNYMSYSVNPSFSSPTGITTTSTQNISFGCGTVLPDGLVPIEFPPPPIAIDGESQNIESIVDRRLNTSSASVQPNTIYSGGEGNKTAREISYKASLQTLATNYETMSWKKFIRECLRYAWELMIQPDHKNQTLQFYMKNTLQELPPDSFNGGYNIVLSWSVDNINKEFNIQQARQLWQDAMMMRDPVLAQNTWNAYSDQAAPGQGEKFHINPEGMQADMMETIGKELAEMLVTGFPVRPKESVDHYLAVAKTIQFIQNENQRGTPIPQDRIELLNQYIAAHKDMLKKSNPEQWQQLMQQLNQIDAATKQQQMQQSLQNQMAGAKAQQMARSGGLPAQPQLPPQQATQPQPATMNV